MEGMMPADFRVAAVQPFSPLDFPGRLSAVLFLAGCPWRCPYCHNPALQRRGGGGIAWPRLARWLRAREGLLDAVVISGGEPTVSPFLPALAQAVKALGYEVGLHTAGAVPARLAAVLRSLDWIGLDIKAPFAAYAKVTGRARSGARAEAALDLVQSGGVPFEIRTTYDPDLLDPDLLMALAADLARHGVKRWVLQGRAEEGRASPPVLPSVLLAGLQDLVPEVVLRG